MTVLQDQIPLKVLVADGDNRQVEALARVLNKHEAVVSVKCANSISSIQEHLRAEECNTIFIDPLSFNLDAASDLILSIRQALPEIVFVLHVNWTEVELRRSEFFKGPRSRFNHYFRLDKRTPDRRLSDEVDAVVSQVQRDLSSLLSATSLERLRSEVVALERSNKSAAESNVSYAYIAKKLEEAIAGLPTQVAVEPRSVFVSYRFEEQAYFKGIAKLLEQRGLQVVTGQRAHQSISAVIIDRIRKSELFLSIMTRHNRLESGRYTTSAWLIEEKGVALALGKRIVLMVEEGVDEQEIGGLQGDWQRIHFEPKEFLSAALDAVEQLASYTGIGVADAQTKTRRG